MLSPAQLRLSQGSRPGQIEKLAKTREFLWRLAECYERMGCLAHVEAQLRELLCMSLASEEQRLEALCFLADIQVRALSRLPGVDVFCIFRAQHPPAVLSCQWSIRRSRASLADGSCRNQVSSEEMPADRQHAHSLSLRKV